MWSAFLGFLDCLAWIAEVERFLLEESAAEHKHHISDIPSTSFLIAVNELFLVVRRDGGSILSEEVTYTVAKTGGSYQDYHIGCP